MVRENNEFEKIKISHAEKLFCSTNGENKECIICLESTENKTQCCGAGIHAYCIIGWWKVNRTCPHCRKDMLDEKLWKKYYKIEICDTEEENMDDLLDTFRRGMSFTRTIIESMNSNQAPSQETWALLGEILTQPDTPENRARQQTVANDLAVRAANSLFNVLGHALNQYLDS